eukprot:2791432-Amphidinium_carterae.1
MLHDTSTSLAGVGLAAPSKAAHEDIPAKDSHKPCPDSPLPTTLVPANVLFQGCKSPWDQPLASMPHPTRSPKYHWNQSQANEHFGKNISERNRKMLATIWSEW